MRDMRDMMGSYHSAMIAQGSNISRALESSFVAQSTTQARQEVRNWIEEAHTIFYDTEEDGDFTSEARLSILDIFNTDARAARGYVLLRKESDRKLWVRKRLTDAGFSSIIDDPTGL
jgi:hypothetical protein